MASLFPCNHLLYHEYIYCVINMSINKQRDLLDLRPLFFVMVSEFNLYSLQREIQHVKQVNSDSVL